MYGQGRVEYLGWSLPLHEDLEGNGPSGLCANVYIMGGAMHSSLAREFAARHRLQARLIEAGEDERALLQISEFTLSIKCVRHGCNNGPNMGG